MVATDFMASATLFTLQRQVCVTLATLLTPQRQMCVASWLSMLQQRVKGRMAFLGSFSSHTNAVQKKYAGENARICVRGCGASGLRPRKREASGL